MKQKHRSGEYNGHRNWNAWRIALEFGNDQALYDWTSDLVNRFGIGRAAGLLSEELAGQTTPDGATFNKTAIRLALRDWR